MFNIGIGEMFIILLIALIVVGPERMPELARKLGGMIRDVRRMYDNLRGELGTDFDEVERAIRTLKSLDPRRELDAYGRKVIQELAQDVGPEAETLLKSSPSQIKETLKQQLSLAPEGSVAQGAVVQPASASETTAEAPSADTTVEAVVSAESEAVPVAAPSIPATPRRTSRVYEQPASAPGAEAVDGATAHPIARQNGAPRRSKVYSDMKQAPDAMIARLGHDLLSDNMLDRPVRETVADSSSNGHGAS